MSAPAPTGLRCARGEFTLHRYPRRRRETLQAWCAADLLLIEACSETNSPLLVVNDEHGALSIALSADTMWTDSAVSADAVRQNCLDNDTAVPRLVWSTVAPPGEYAAVALRIPKQLPYFEYQLAQLAAGLAQGTRLHFAGMDKHLSPHTATLIEKYFGSVERHRGQRKARLFSTVQSTPASETRDFSSGYDCEHLGGYLGALPNVFSRDSLDIGTRFLLDHLSQLAPAANVADLACGNGVLGIAALQQGLADTITFADESAMAIASARENCRRLVGDTQRARFHHGDGLQGQQGKFELILCNPPFHLGHTVDEFAGRRLLEQCADHLARNGELVLVANSHLRYGHSLNKRFRSVEQLARNNKFILWRARHGC